MRVCMHMCVRAYVSVCVCVCVCVLWAPPAGCDLHMILINEILCSSFSCFWSDWQRTNKKAQNIWLRLPASTSAADLRSSWQRLFVWLFFYPYVCLFSHRSCSFLSSSLRLLSLVIKCCLRVESRTKSSSLLWARLGSPPFFLLFWHTHQSFVICC